MRTQEKEKVTLELRAVHRGRVTGWQSVCSECGPLEGLKRSHMLAGAEGTAHCRTEHGEPSPRIRRRR